MKGLELNVSKQNGMTLVEYQQMHMMTGYQTRLPSLEISYHSSIRMKMEREVLFLMYIMTTHWKLC